MRAIGSSSGWIGESQRRTAILSRQKRESQPFGPTPNANFYTFNQRRSQKQQRNANRVKYQQPPSLKELAGTIQLDGATKCPGAVGGVRNGPVGARDTPRLKYACHTTSGAFDHARF
jgi:hypothetical protein